MPSDEPSNSDLQRQILELQREIQEIRQRISELANENRPEVSEEDRLLSDPDVKWSGMP